MNENAANRLFGQTPTRYGVASLVAACLAIASWPMSVAIGLMLIWILFPLAIVAVVSGLLGIGSGLYHGEPVGVVTGALGSAIACYGAYALFWAMTHF